MKKIKALEQILKFIASGQIPQELYDKYLANTEIGFMRYEDLKEYFNIPKPRTEQEILKDFEKLGYEIDKGWTYVELVRPEYEGAGIEYVVLFIDKKHYEYECYYKETNLSYPIALQEHKLLNELFECWNWN